MIRLHNITKDGDIVTAEIEVVDDKHRRYVIKVDVQKREVISCTSEYRGMFERGAFAKILKLWDEYGENIPKEEVAVWY